MSSNKSENLGLHLWEGEDNFLRTEFNENFQAIDAGVKAEETARKAAVQAEQDARESAIQQVKDSITSTGGSASQAVEALRSELTGKITAAQNAADAAQETADKAYSPDQKPYVVGSYYGNGSTSKTINVGFQPSCICITGGTMPFIATSSGCGGYKASVTWNSDGVTITGGTSEYAMNYTTNEYAYIAFR